MKIKKILEKSLKIIAYSFLILLLNISIYKYYQYEADLFQLKHLEVKGNSYLSDEEIIQSLSLNKTMNIFDCDIKKMKEDIEKITFVKTATIGLKIPNKIEIQITERIPIALIIHEQKKFFIDYEHSIIPVELKSLNNFPVPIINIERKDLNNSNSINMIKYLYKNYSTLYNKISEVVEVQSKITLITNLKTKIFLNPKMTMSNINKLENFEKTIQSINDLNDYKYIDLIHENQIVVKERVYS